MPNTKDRYVLEQEHLQNLFDLLIADKYEIIGPTLQDGVISYEPIDNVSELPAGWTDEQKGGEYRVSQRDDDALFGYTSSPQSWKRYLYPSRLELWQATRNNGSFAVAHDTAQDDQPRYAFVGVRACELHAIEIQDRVLMDGAFVDPIYKQRRESCLVVAVNCAQAGGTCFCDSMGTGPRVTANYDLALTEIIRKGQHFFVLEVGSEKGQAYLENLPHRKATDEEAALPEAVTNNTRQHMGRTVNTDNMRELLHNNYDNPRWDEVTKRCLSCGNCTMVCPTCFCHTVEDVTDLTGQTASRWRIWDSCFTGEFSYIHGGNVRDSSKSRYRQWMTHKLSTWFDQFGSAGCVGCGRCITWCPVAIDITEELAAIREYDASRKKVT